MQSSVNGILRLGIREKSDEPRRGMEDSAQIAVTRRRCWRTGQTLAANPAIRQWRSVEILQAAADGRARQTRDLGDRLHSAPSRRPHLPGREHPPTAFIELRADGLPTFANRWQSIMPIRISTHRSAGNPAAHHIATCRLTLLARGRESTRTCYERRKKQSTAGRRVIGFPVRLRLSSLPYTWIVYVASRDKQT